jgi:UDP-N-acetylglucosamine 4-epimerase
MDYEQTRNHLKNHCHTWLVTGVAGFIGSHLLETLLLLNQKVIGIDNFSTGFQKNLDAVKNRVGSKNWLNFNFIHGDIRSIDDCRLVCKGVDYVLHQAALGSVPRSIDDPLSSHQSNIDGFLNVLISAKDAKVKNFVFASSSSVYGDNPLLIRIEEEIGKPLSPYALTKYVDELYAQIFFKTYGFNSIGLRYFNTFGPRQNPEGAYAAVIPKWINSMLHNQEVFINGDGLTSRDFCYVDNVVQANILAALTSNPLALNRIFNVACHQTTSLNKLFEIIKLNLNKNNKNYTKLPIYRDARPGDIRHSLASIAAIQKFLNYKVLADIHEGMQQLIIWVLLQEKTFDNKKNHILI